MLPDYEEELAALTEQNESLELRLSAAKEDYQELLKRCRSAINELIELNRNEGVYDDVGYWEEQLKTLRDMEEPSWW